MSFSLGPYTVTELRGSKERTWSRDGLTATRILKCAWADVDGLAEYLLGYTYDLGGNSIWNLPQRYKAGLELYVNHVASRGWRFLGNSTEADGSAKYAFGILRVTYGPLEDLASQGGSTGTWAEAHSKSHAEFQQIQGWDLKWADAAVPFPHDAVAAELMVVTDLTYVRYNYALTAAKKTALNGMIGKLNSLAFDGKQPFTLMFAGWDSDRTLDARGKTLKYAVTINLKHRNYEWSSFPRHDGWTTVKRKDGSSLFSSADFGTL